MNRKRLFIVFGTLGFVVLVLAARYFGEKPASPEPSFLSAEAVEIFDTPVCPADRTLTVQYQSGAGETYAIQSSKVLVQSHHCERATREEFFLAKSHLGFEHWKKVRLLAGPGDVLESLRLKSGQLLLSASGAELVPPSAEAWIFSEELSHFLSSPDLRNRILPDDLYLMAEEVLGASLQGTQDAKNILYSAMGAGADTKFLQLSLVKKSEILGKVLD